MTITQPTPVAPPLPSAISLAHGRTMAVRRDELTVTAPDGRVEIELVITADGPVVRVSGARLEMAAVEDVAIRGRRLDVTTTEGIDLRTAGPVAIIGDELRAKTTRSIHLNGETVRLNCPADPAESDAPSE